MPVTTPGPHRSKRLRSLDSIVRWGAGAALLALALLVSIDTEAQATGTVPCDDADPSVLCLNGERFEVRADWVTSEASGTGTGERLTSDTGYFWFFRDTNVEVVIKVLDGCAANDHFWVFAGGLTNVEVTLTVRDAGTGITRQYANPQNSAFRPLQDTTAFPCEVENPPPASAVSDEAL